MQLRHSFIQHCSVLGFTHVFLQAILVFYFLFSCIQNNKKVPLILLIENEVLLEEHLPRVLQFHVSLKRIFSDSFWKGHENLTINFFSQTT